jgi:hypothetical protein
MSILRPFHVADLFKFNNMSVVLCIGVPSSHRSVGSNLDIWTETVWMSVGSILGGCLTYLFLPVRNRFLPELPLQVARPVFRSGSTQWPHDGLQYVSESPSSLMVHHHPLKSLARLKAVALNGTGTSLLLPSRPSTGVSLLRVG